MNKGNDMTKLNLTAAQRIGVRVTYEVNQFVVYGPAGSGLEECRLTAAYTKDDLRAELKSHGLTGAVLDASASSKYSKLFA